MQDYSFLGTPKGRPEVTEDAKAAFALARADHADQHAAYWAEQGDEIQAQRWRATAASLRGEA